MAAPAPVPGLPPWARNQRSGAVISSMASGRRGAKQTVQELDTLVIDRPTEVLDDPFCGRHRAAPSTARRAVTRMVLGSVALAAVALLGWVTADAVGLTSTDVPAAADFPVGSLRPDEADPRPARTVDITTRPTPTPEPQVPDAGSSAPEAGPASPAVRAPRAPVEPSPVQGVKVGDACPSPGVLGVTAKGKQAVCTSGEGPTRWKHA